MSNQLQTNLETILNEKVTKILPENIKKDVQIFNVIGTLETGSGSSNIKIFNTADEMNASEGNNDGDIAVIYNLTEVPITSDGLGIDANALILPDTLNTSLTTARIKAHTNIIADDEYFVSLTLPNGNGMLGTDSGGNGFDTYGKINTSDTFYTRGKGSSNRCFGNIFSLENIYMHNGDYSVTSIDITEGLNSDVWNYVKFVKISDILIYQYDGNLGSWSILPNNYHILPEDLTINKQALGFSGIVTGTFDKNKTIKFNAVPGMSSNIVNSLVDTTSIVHDDLTLLLDISNIPKGFGDKRYFFSLAPDDMHGAGLYRWGAVYFDDPDTKIYMGTDGIISSKPNHESGYFTAVFGKMLTIPDVHPGMTNITCFALENTIAGINNTKAITGMSKDTGETAGWWNRGTWIATNMDIIQDSTGKVVYKGGPKASEIRVGSGYYNIFGEWVEGTYEPNYTELGTISPTEYNTAVNTSNDILGNAAE